MTADSPEVGVDIFLRREDAHQALAGCLAATGCSVVSVARG
jgi:hypothetical protein